MLEYIALCFNHDNYLVGLSGVPDYKLVLWDWKKGVRLHSVQTSIRVSFLKSSLLPVTATQFYFRLGGD